MVHTHGGVISTVIEITGQVRGRDANDFVHGNGHVSYLGIEQKKGVLVAKEAHIKVPIAKLANLVY